ncbi:hypothetical protein [Fluviicola taffensis]|uniref:hypothetical protein n=1 Tax=Fluviicola taffensis TaxID=191579 RepID=UPI003137E68F
MSTAELRLDLHKMIEGITDQATLSAVYAFLSGSKELPESDWADNLSKEEDAEILEGLKQESEGKVKSHDQILAKHRKQFPHLKL